jgi:uncharacterized membrane protein
MKQIKEMREFWSRVLCLARKVRIQLIPLPLMLYNSHTKNIFCLNNRQSAAVRIDVISVIVHRACTFLSMRPVTGLNT